MCSNDHFQAITFVTDTVTYGNQFSNFTESPNIMDPEMNKVLWDRDEHRVSRQFQSGLGNHLLTPICSPHHKKYTATMLEAEFCAVLLKRYKNRVITSQHENFDQEPTLGFH